MRVRIAVILAAAAVAALGAALVASDGSDDPSPVRPATSAERQTSSTGAEVASHVPATHPRGAVADCSTRSEARFPGAFTEPANLVVGPLVLIGGAHTPARTVRQFGGNKFPLLVRSDHTVTVELPRAARHTTVIGWGPLRRRGAPPRVHHHTISFVACSPGEASGSSADGTPVTFWSGGVSTDAPRCVPLRVYVDDEPEPRRVGLPLGRLCEGAVPSRCPAGARDALPLGENAASKAERIVLRPEDPEAMPEARVLPAAEAPVRGRSARYYCGARIARETLVVFVHRAAFDSGPNRSASLAQGVFLVSRFADGYRVWFTLHG